MKRYLFFCFTFGLLGIGCLAQKKDAEEILERYKTFLLLTDTSRHECSAIPPINSQGRWNDINYNDDQPGDWQLSTHLRRIRSLAFCLATQKLPVDVSAQVKKTISLALNDWIVHRYKSKNWWHNEIGVPQIIRDILVMAKKDLSQHDFIESLEILNQLKVKGTGANLVWSADLGLHYGALTNDTSLMRHCRDTILSVIKISTGEGVQPDYSFHQHGKRLQMYHYGGAFLADDVRLAWELKNTGLAFPPGKLQLLDDFVLKGWQWMARGINTVPGTIDRAASRKNALRSADVRDMIPLMCELQPDSTKAFKKMLEIQNAKDALVGYRYFPFSDFTSYQQKNFSFFQKGNSTRTLLTESINEENLKGNLLNSGDTYFIVDGNEYYNLMPFWDWNHLPGTTNFNGERKTNIVSHSFVGNVSNGSSGLSVMDYELKQSEKTLRAKKFWASWENLTVALVAGLKTGETSIVTTMEQSRWQGKVVTNRTGNRLKEGNYGFKNLNWIYHHHFVYVPLFDDSIKIALKSVDASWYDINHSESPAILHDKIFQASIIHKNSSSGYVVAYTPSDAEAAKTINKPRWKILRNDTLCQAVKFIDGTIMTAIYKEGEVRLSKTISLSVSRPCLVLINGREILASDPAHKGGTLTLRWQNTEHNVFLPEDGMSARVDN